MSISLDVHLLSGKSASLIVETDASVESLKRLAQSALEAGKGRLLRSSGEVLDGASSVQEAGPRDGDVLTLHMKQVAAAGAKRHSASPALAAILGDGSVVTWGLAGLGDDSTAVQEQLTNAQQIHASIGKFAAILGDGSVVTTWTGGPYVPYVSNDMAVPEQLKNVQQIQASFGACAAILGNGSVVTWGAAGLGGDSSAVQAQLKDVQQIQASRSAFAAILGDGSVVTWGDAARGGDSSAVQEQLHNVQQIQASLGAFAAILPAEECAADPGFPECVCCNPGRWICGHLG